TSPNRANRWTAKAAATGSWPSTTNALAMRNVRCSAPSSNRASSAWGSMDQGPNASGFLSLVLRRGAKPRRRGGHRRGKRGRRHGFDAGRRGHGAYGFGDQGHQAGQSHVLRCHLLPRGTWVVPDIVAVAPLLEQSGLGQTLHVPVDAGGRQAQSQAQFFLRDARVFQDEAAHGQRDLVLQRGHHAFATIGVAAAFAVEEPLVPA